MNYTIFYPTPLSEIHDITNDNIDVCVQADNGKRHTFVVTTPKNLDFLMKKDNLSCISPDFRFLTVTALTESAIRAVIDAVMKEPALTEWYGED